MAQRWQPRHRLSCTAGLPAACCSISVSYTHLAKLNEESINQLPNSGIVKKGTDIQIVYGLQVADIKRAVEAQLENQ